MCYQPETEPSSVPMSTLDPMVGPRDRVLSFSKAPMMHETPLTNSTATIGRAECSKSARIGMPAVREPWDTAAAAEADLEVLEVDSEAGSAAVEDLQVLEETSEAAMAEAGSKEVAVAALIPELSAEALPRPTSSPTSPRPEPTVARSSTCET